MPASPAPSSARPLRSAHRAVPLPLPNCACWCGSGKKYKRCHRRADENSRVLDQRHGPLSCALVEVLGPIMEGLPMTDDYRGLFVWMMGMAWSISRLHEARWDTAIRRVTRNLEGPQTEHVVELLRLLCTRARSLYPDDPRRVLRAWVVRRGEARVLCATGTLGD